jgi:hypothetical protein
VTSRRWIEYLIAILAGNGIYFAVLYPGLPAALRHQPFDIDAGLLVDFLCCVLVYAAIRLGVRHARRPAGTPSRLLKKGVGVVTSAVGSDARKRDDGDAVASARSDEPI